VDFLTDLGIGLAIGMLAGTTGTHGSARGRMTILAAVIGLIVGFLLDGGLGAALALVGAVGGCLVISDIVSGASRREGSGAGALAFFVSLAALAVAGIALLVPIVIIAVVLALLWLGISRHRRAQRKHAGLRVLR
jgi:prepilin signal peptidase PulO-like enzyme (type II secretory pathway)